ncbi:MAG: PilZ domain-containing protein [Calditrichaeota bacterium]|nr:MAG: PilZ domain-containing protein [Calditrichota bacterium]MBL1205533.1 PilZ domain-containing protein [Calditrichota bacterium]NOG45362.1 PilZ domain-containing protein [Calditrichota bacterium]
MRSFIRHAANMPIHFNFQSDKNAHKQNMQNVSTGGLCFFSDSEIPSGSHLSVKIPNLKYPFVEECVVMWCRKAKKRYEVGVKFNDDKTSFRMRMIEQICYIEKYRDEMIAKGRDLDWQDASKEWIAKYAKDFPQLEN